MKLRLMIIAALVALVVAVIMAVWLLRPATVAVRLDPALWARFVQRFVTADGRIVDHDNGGISHTEGQGYGMLLAEAAGDRERFEQIWAWSNRHLRRPDGLFSWRFGPCTGAGAGTPETGATECVTDSNNASDGDILIAWALLRAGQDWHRSDYRDSAAAIAGHVADHLVVDLGGRTLLLPGIDGFAHETWLVVNPSYWIFPAFDAFAEAFGNPQWRALTQSGYTLLREARFGDWHLPSDWLRVDADSVTPAPGFPPRFSYDAVRIPLNLAWAAGAPAELSQPFQGFWAAPHGNQTPAWVDIDDGSVAPYAWPTGMQSIAWLAGAGADHHRTGPPPLPRDDEGYYSWGLSLLCRVAAADRSP